MDPKAVRPSPVTLAQRSLAALPKTVTKATTGGGPVHSFATLLEDLATIAASRIQPADGLPAFTVITTPVPSSAEPSDCSASPTAPVRAGRHLKITTHFRRQTLYRAPHRGTSV